VSYARSSGPGGQNVNKLNTRAEISFDFHACTLLRDPQRDAILARLSRRLTRDGRLRVVSQRARTQLANRIHAERQLLALLELALAVDRPRRPTAPTRASRAVRVRAKRQRGQVKRWRRGPSSAED
jgi:ribosome-associated protein